MQVQKSLRIAHTSSVLISFIINGLLVLALVTFITISEGIGEDESTVMVLDPVQQEDIDELEEEIEPEEVVDPDDLDELLDFTLDTPMETEFEAETDMVDDVTNTDVTSLSELMSDVSSPVVMKGLLVGRTPKARKAMAARYGNGLEKFSEPAVMKALEWLRDHQHTNGSWTKEGSVNGGGGNVGYTGLALLAFLAHGETPASAEFGPTVAKGIRFLVENQDSRGVFQPAGGHTVYGHAIASYALAEAYSMTENILLQEPLQRAVAVMQKGQMPNGGYDYDYKRETRNDLSVGAWHVQALKAAYITGVTGPETKKYLNSAMDGMLEGSKVGSEGRGFTYSVTKKGEVGRPRRIISAAGTLGLHLSGRKGSKETKEALDYMERFVETDRLPQWGNKDVGGEYGGEIMFWYYAVQAYFHDEPEGKNFKRFMAATVKALVQNQAEDGHWQCYTENGKKQGAVFNTALGALGLMVYYRHLPTTKAENIQPAGIPAPAGGGEEEGDVGFEI